MIQIKKAKQSDIKDILRLKQELIMLLTKGQFRNFSIFKNVNSIKNKFFNLSKKLTNPERAFLWRLCGYYSWNKKRRVSKEKFKSLSTDFCNRYFLKNIDFDLIVKNLAKNGFIKDGKDHIILNIPDKELLSVEEQISKDLLIKYLSKKQKLEKLKLKTIYLIAKEKEKTLGYLFGYIIKFSSYNLGEIDELIVTEKAQGRRVGSQLINNFLDICKKDKVSFVIVCTPKENKRAIEFYKNCGFKKEENVYLYWERYSD